MIKYYKKDLNLDDILRMNKCKNIQYDTKILKEFRRDKCTPDE